MTQAPGQSIFEKRHERTMADYLRPLLSAVYPPSAGQAPKPIMKRLSQLRLLTRVTAGQKSQR
jgi:hypothetical protein